MSSITPGTGLPARRSRHRRARRKCPQPPASRPAKARRQADAGLPLPLALGHRGRPVPLPRPVRFPRVAKSRRAGGQGRGCQKRHGREAPPGPGKSRPDHAGPPGPGLGCHGPAPLGRTGAGRRTRRPLAGGPGRPQPPLGPRHRAHRRGAPVLGVMLRQAGETPGCRADQVSPPHPSTLYFRHGGDLRSIHPDAFWVVRVDGRTFPFFMGWERRPVHPSTMAARLAPYPRYCSSSRPLDDHGHRPLILVSSTTSWPMPTSSAWPAKRWSAREWTCHRGCHSGNCRRRSGLWEWPGAAPAYSNQVELSSEWTLISATHCDQLYCYDTSGGEPYYRRGKSLLESRYMRTYRTSLLRKCHSRRHQYHEHVH